MTPGFAIVAATPSGSSLCLVKEIAVRAPGFQGRLHRGRRYRQVEESKRSFVGL
jgi:hypothetical protein